MIITVAHQKGGVGKSTIAFNLAVEFQKKFQVKLLDLDIQKTLSYTNILRKEHQDMLDLEQVNQQRLEEILSSPKNNILYILDLGGFDSSLNRVALFASDLILTPVSDEGVEILGLQEFEKVLKELSQLADQLVQSFVVLNKINPSSKKFDDLKDFINNSEHYQVLNSVIRRRVDLSRSLARGLSVEEYKPNSVSTQEIQNLVEEINNLIRT